MADETEREAQLKHLEQLKALGEKAYDDMYEVHSQHDVNACYRDAKDCFYDAIGLAGRLGLKEEADALSERLAHIKAVYRSQFAG
jgi:hypothetical protein